MASPEPRLHLLSRADLEVRVAVRAQRMREHVATLVLWSSMYVALMGVLLWVGDALTHSAAFAVTVSHLVASCQEWRGYRRARDERMAAERTLAVRGGVNTHGSPPSTDA